jgi:aquaporin Z
MSILTVILPAVQERRIRQDGQESSQHLLTASNPNRQMNTIRKNLGVYLIEAWALGMFMFSACAVTILLEHPDAPGRMVIEDGVTRRVLNGIAMGLTAILLIYSPWGKRSGAHMNPAVTLANFQMQRISLPNTIGYIIAQCFGGVLIVLLFSILVPDLISHPGVSYVATVPPMHGYGLAFLLEFGMSAVLFTLLLICSNSKYASYTGIVAGILVALFITLEAPFSGMSINPARTLASAWPSGIWDGWWIYLLAPTGGMMCAGILYRAWYRAVHQGNCLSMTFHLSGSKNCVTYEVTGPKALLAEQLH